MDSSTLSSQETMDYHNEELPKIPNHTINELVADHLKESIKLNKDPIIQAKLSKCLEMICGVDEYIEKLCPPETPLQSRIYKDTMMEPWNKRFEEGKMSYTVALEMMGCKHSTQFLKQIATISKAERVLEIGMLTGYSAAVLCDVENVKKLVGLELEPFLVNFIQKHFEGTKEGQKLEILVGPGLTGLETLKERGDTFDLVYIDADKKNYINYYKFILDNNLIGSGGLFVLDNSLWKGEIFTKEQASPNGEHFKILNEFIHQDDRVEQVILQISDGVSLVRRK